MPIAKDLALLGKRIALHHGWAAAKAFKSYEMSDADRVVVSQSAVDLLRVFPDVAGASAMMSAALAVQLESRLQAPVHVVAGTLSVEGAAVLGDGAGFDGAQVFAEADPRWNGHVWVMIGATIVDVSIFRTAYSAQGPARLAKHVDLVFGPGKGLYVDPWQRSSQRGLGYDPHYVLSAQEVTRLMGGAFHAIKAAKTA
jgi:hypothetical protein